MDDTSLVGETYRRNRINGVSFKFSVNDGNSAFFICVDNFRIVRGDYEECRFEDSVYLANNEHIVFPLEEFDPYKGTIEFFALRE